LVKQLVVVITSVAVVASLVLDGGMNSLLAVTCWKPIRVMVVVLE
jgi:hypothetical protein